MYSSGVVLAVGSQFSFDQSHAFVAYVWILELFDSFLNFGQLRERGKDRIRKSTQLASTSWFHSSHILHGYEITKWFLHCFSCAWMEPVPQRILHTACVNACASESLLPSSSACNLLPHCHGFETLAMKCKQAFKCKQSEYSLPVI